MFYSGRGIYSAVWAQLIALIPVGIAYYIACRHFKLLPRPGKWGKPTVKVFREIFAFGFDMFLFVLGLQLVNASQTVLITRVLGLEAGAVWSVGTRVFSLLGQIIGRIFDFAAPALAEMIVRGERGRLLERFRSLATLSLSLGIFAGSGYALCNRAFVSVWTSGRMQWAAENDLLLGFWLCLQLLTRVHVGLIGQSKEFRFLRYIYFFEGIFFIGGGLLSLKGGGISLMILVSIVGTMLFSLPYSLWRTAEYFGISWRTVTSGWCRPSFVFAACLLPVAVVLAWVARFWSPQFQLAVLPVTCGVIGITFLIRVGLDPLLRDEICRRAPTVFRPLIHVLAGVPAATADRH